MDLSNNQTINLLNQIIIDYNDNINYYNSNMRHLINSITRIVDTEYTHHSNYGSNISDHSSMFTRRRSLSSQNPPQLQQRLAPQPVYNNLGYQIFPWFSQRRTFQDVVVRPTQEQIDTACEYYTYEESMAENTCPISLVPFRAGDEICRIRHCRHSFKKHYILEWFRYNVRCPVCRYDIREYLNHLDLSNNNIERNYSSDESTGTESGSVPPSSTSATSDSPPSTRRNYNPYRSENTNNTTNNRNSNVFQRFGSSLETFLTQELNNMNLNDSVSELLYSFDIPIHDRSTNNNTNSGTNNNTNNNNTSSSSSLFTNVSSSSSATTPRETIVEYDESDEEKNNDSDFVIEDVVDISNNYS